MLGLLPITLWGLLAADQLSRHSSEAEPSAPEKRLWTTCLSFANLHCSLQISPGSQDPATGRAGRQCPSHTISTFLPLSGRWARTGNRLCPSGLPHYLVRREERKCKASVDTPLGNQTLLCINPPHLPKNHSVGHCSRNKLKESINNPYTWHNLSHTTKSRGAAAAKYNCMSTNKQGAQETSQSPDHSVPACSSWEQRPWALQSRPHPSLDLRRWRWASLVPGKPLVPESPIRLWFR